MMIGKDKWAHFIYSAFGTAFIGALATILIADYVWAIIVGAAIMLTIGVVKEFYFDKYLKRGAFEKADLLADLLGCCFGLIVMLVFIAIVK